MARHRPRRRDGRLTEELDPTPVLRPLRLLRLLSVVAMAQRGSLWLFRGRIALDAGVTTLALVLLAGIAVLDAEQNDPRANVHDIGDAWWWAFTTITTVGYGDFSPVTLAGRLAVVAADEAAAGSDCSANVAPAARPDG